MKLWAITFSLLQLFMLTTAFAEPSTTCLNYLERKIGTQAAMRQCEGVAGTCYEDYLRLDREDEAVKSCKNVSNICFNKLKRDISPDESSKLCLNVDSKCFKKARKKFGNYVAISMCQF